MTTVDGCELVEIGVVEMVEMVDVVMEESELLPAGTSPPHVALGNCRSARRFFMLEHSHTGRRLRAHTGEADHSEEKFYPLKAYVQRF